MPEDKDKAPAGGEARIGPIVVDALDKMMATLRTRGKARMEELAQKGREQLELRQARKDLDRLFTKLGRETWRLVEAGEVDHPGLVAGVERIRRQEELVKRMEAENPENEEEPLAESEAGG